MRVQSEPVPTRPYMPGYGIPDTAPDVGTFPWSWVSEQMEHSRSYWIASTRPDGRPHVMPVWGVWLDETFYFSTGRSSRKGRNLSACPEVAVHLESGDDAVILEGMVHEVTDPQLFARFADAYDAKYGLRPERGDQGSVIYRLNPRVAFSWTERDFAATATKWQFVSPIR